MIIETRSRIPFPTSASPPFGTAPRVPTCGGCRVEGALCAYVIRLRVFYTQNDETLSRTSLTYMSNANLPIAVTVARGRRSVFLWQGKWYDAQVFSNGLWPLLRLHTYNKTSCQLQLVA